MDVSVEGNLLTIAGDRKDEQEERENGGRYHVWERRYGMFRRSFTLSQAVDPDHIVARSNDGILTITLPKTKKAKAVGRRIR